MWACFESLIHALSLFCHESCEHVSSWCYVSHPRALLNLSNLSVNSDWVLVVYFTPVSYYKLCLWWILWTLTECLLCSPSPGVCSEGTYFPEGSNACRVLSLNLPQKNHFPSVSSVSFQAFCLWLIASLSSMTFFYNESRRHLLSASCIYCSPDTF